MVGLEKRSLSLERRYAGTYVSAGTDAERAAVNAAVDSATDGWGSPQGFARSALMKRSEIRPTYTISFDDKGVVSVETPGYPPEFSADQRHRGEADEQVWRRKREPLVGGALLQQGPDGRWERFNAVKRHPTARPWS